MIFFDPGKICKDSTISEINGIALNLDLVYSSLCSLGFLNHDRKSISHHGLKYSYGSKLKDIKFNDYIVKLILLDIHINKLCKNQASLGNRKFKNINDDFEYSCIGIYDEKQIIYNFEIEHENS
jgi:hypothetical protein